MACTPLQIWIKISLISLIETIFCSAHSSNVGPSRNSNTWYANGECLRSMS